MSGPKLCGGHAGEVVGVSLVHCQPGHCAICGAPTGVAAEAAAIRAKADATLGPLERAHERAAAEARRLLEPPTFYRGQTFGGPREGGSGASVTVTKITRPGGYISFDNQEHPKAGTYARTPRRS